jgi:hypothetical protein
MPILPTVLSSLLFSVFSLSPVQSTQPGERWVRIDRNDELVLYVDSWTIKKADSEVRLWTRWEFAKLQTMVDKRFDVMVSEFALDCPGVRTMQIEATFYRAGNVELTLQFPESMRTWSGAPPQSVNETLTVRGCLLAAGKPIAPVK